jgi:hypothetical protein
MMVTGGNITSITDQLVTEEGLVEQVDVRATDAPTVRLTRMAAGCGRHGP